MEYEHKDIDAERGYFFPYLGQDLLHLFAVVRCGELDLPHVEGPNPLNPVLFFSPHMHSKGERKVEKR